MGEKQTSGEQAGDAGAVDGLVDPRLNGQKAWVEVVFIAPEGPALAAADHLVNFTGQGVLQEEVEDRPDLVRIRGYLAAGPEMDKQLAQLRQYAAELSLLEPGEGGVRAEFKSLDPQDWAGGWRQHFRPKSLTPRLMVAPPWEEARPRFGQQVVIIDPGQAFGTGQHESTLLCLEHLERLRRRWTIPEKILDVGTGSGILALAGLRLGAARAVGLDIDPAAVDAARHNARLNGLSSRFEVMDLPLSELEETFPLVLANLTAGDLIPLAPQLTARLAKRGGLVVSGLLVNQAAAVKRVFMDLGLHLLEEDSMGGWSSLVME